MFKSGCSTRNKAAADAQGKEKRFRSSALIVSPSIILPFSVDKRKKHFFKIPSKATDEKGFGVFAGSFIPKGSFITTYLGRYVSSETED